ncbi:MAG: hypothetical protein U5K29_11130 [Acidimicrobiales bacterium]|nr:hypothetical protein [Acidimicrobiales bacterium]
MTTTDTPGAGSPDVTSPSLGEVVPPTIEPVVVTASYPAGEYLASIAQLLVGTCETCTAQDVVELIPVRRMVHEVACHLDRLVQDGLPIAVRIAAASGQVDVELSGRTVGDGAVVDTWLLEQARQVFDRVEVDRRDDELVIGLGRIWELPGG